MDNMIVYMDEAAYALKMLTPMIQSGEARTPTRWIWWDVRRASPTTPANG